MRTTGVLKISSFWIWASRRWFQSYVPFVSTSTNLRCNNYECFCMFSLSIIFLHRSHVSLFLNIDSFPHPLLIFIAFIPLQNVSGPKRIHKTVVECCLSFPVTLYQEHLLPMSYWKIKHDFVCLDVISVRVCCWGIVFFFLFLFLP